MPLRPLALPADVPGRLWLGPMPGRLEPWSAFLAEARRVGLRRIVCLSPLDELAALSPDYHEAVVQGRLPLAWRHLPMRNFGLADDLAAWADGVHASARELRAGDVLMLHCAAGIGRTGTVAACLLKLLGLTAEAALAQVRAAGSNPETARQSGCIDRF